MSSFLTYETEFVVFLAMLENSFLPMRVYSIFSGAGKFCLTHELGQLTLDVKSYVRTENFRSDVIFARPRKTPNDVRKKLCDVICQK